MIAAIAEVFEFRADWHRQNRAAPLVRQYALKLTSILEADPDLLDCVADCCHCGIRFLTIPCNRNRRDLHCPFGCRQHHRRELANARSRKYYQTPQGKKSKEERNALRCPIDQQELPAQQQELPAQQQELPSLQQATLGEEPLLHEQPTGEAARSQDPSIREASLSPSPAEPSSILPLRSQDTSSFEDASERPNRRLQENASPIPSSDTWLWKLEGVVLTYRSLANSPVLSYLCQVVGLIEGHSFTREELLSTLGESLRQRSLTAQPRREYVLSFLNEHPPP